MESITESVNELNLNVPQLERPSEASETDAKSWINLGNKSQASGTANGVLRIHADSTDYDMEHQKRGKCLIFNHENFDNNNACPKRSGSKADADALYTCFRDLDFETKICTDYPSKQVVETVKQISKEDHSDSDCFVCCILTHGECGSLWGKDCKYPIDIILSFLTGDKCPSLAGKPKIFLIQACRGIEFDNGIHVVAKDVTDSGPKTYKIPIFADFLIAYSTVSGYYSWRNPETGSWFVNHLSDVFNKYWRQMDLLSMLTVINQRISYHKESKSLNPEMSGKKQVPCITHTLTRRVFFRAKNGL